MSVEVTVTAAKKNLEEILSKLLPGETATLVSAEGKPMAVLVPLKSSEDAAKVLDWDAEWETLALEIDLAWKSKKAGEELVQTSSRKD